MGLEDTMTTDYPLPIVMHRPFAILDDRYDAPLPFRHVLETSPVEPTVQTAMTSKRRRKLSRQQPSLFEQLPAEIRLQIYEYLGFSSSLNIIARYGKPPEDWIMRKPLEATFPEYNSHELRIDRVLSLKDGEAFDKFYQREGYWKQSKELLCLNRSIRAEVASILLGSVTVKFSYPLSCKPIHYYNWHNLYNRASVRPHGILKNMTIPAYKFTYMRDVKLISGRLGHSYMEPTGGRLGY
ncbi:hypothetical protein BDV95DRAFT_590128 [Massariosphaeria phaeospora]|uniref:Uncharacterized protein n=1 Tax=Massariosphaeria phaeospora TaxID=100035 RepID=A0A7C8IEE7_9PLEO|nr:hypothetical protein BDV95DRAFT_590128 [Massariosphaeria phaeospora]